MRSCSGRALDAMCFPTAQSQFGAVCVEWRLACRMSLLIRPLERQAKPPAPPCWINRLRSRWGRRFRLPVEADFYRSSKIPKTVNTRLTQRRACPTLCRNAKFSLGGPSLIFITLLTRHTSARRPTLPASAGSTKTRGRSTKNPTTYRSEIEVHGENSSGQSPLPDSQVLRTLRRCRPGRPAQPSGAAPPSCPRGTCLL